jgi:hypothetical protein
VSRKRHEQERGEEREQFAAAFVFVIGASASSPKTHDGTLSHPAMRTASG